jgi:hypothetical protein
MAARRSEELADIRQENVSFADVVAQDGMAWTNSIQEGVPREALKLETEDAVPDSKICDMRHINCGVSLTCQKEHVPQLGQQLKNRH